MKCLVIGSGGREHALYWRLIDDKSAEKCWVLPGNGGIPNEHRVDIAVTDHAAIADFCLMNGIELVIVGPEAPLVDGITDYLENRGLTVFGPSQKGAQLEGSKLFAKMIMDEYGVPTAYHYSFTGSAELTEYINTCTSYPIVIKLDGLAAGKGVAIPHNKDEALSFVAEQVHADTPVFVEEFLEGEEASVLGISDGEKVFPFCAAQDHKRVFDGDKGPNTGGMGAYAPAPVVGDGMLERVRKEVLQPVVDGMKKKGIPFKGILYAGLMVKGDELKVLEFNARFGDPETQVLLPLLDGKLGDILFAAAKGKLEAGMLKFQKKHAITVVVASGGYPGSYEKGKEIKGLDTVSDKLMVFHAGTASKEGKILSDGGRVLTVTAIGSTLQEARDTVYDEIGKMGFEKSFYRNDIGYRALKG